MLKALKELFSVKETVLNTDVVISLINRETELILSEYITISKKISAEMNDEDRARVFNELIALVH